MRTAHIVPLLVLTVFSSYHKFMLEKVTDFKWYPGKNYTPNRTNWVYKFDFSSAFQGDTSPLKISMSAQARNAALTRRSIFSHKLGPPLDAGWIRPWGVTLPTLPPPPPKWNEISIGQILGKKKVLWSVGWLQYGWLFGWLVDCWLVLNGKCKCKLHSLTIRLIYKHIAIIKWGVRTTFLDKVADIFQTRNKKSSECCCGVCESVCVCVFFFGGSHPNYPSRVGPWFALFDLV